MGRVRLVDAPGVAWTLSLGFTPSRAAAIASWPLWLLPAVVDVTLLHAERRVVLALRRGRFASWRQVRRVVLLAAATIVALVVVDVPARSVLGVPVGTLALSGFLLAALPGVALLLRGASDGPALRVVRPGRYDATWTVDMLAARPRAGGLSTAASHLAGVVRPGEAIVVRAATQRHVRAYRRYGFVVVDENDPLLLRRPGRVDELQAVV